MIRVEIFDDMPVYAHGLSVLLEQNGLQVSGIHRSGDEIGSWWRADVLVVTLPIALTGIGDSSLPPRSTPQLLLTDGTTGRSIPLDATIRGCVRRDAPISTVVSAVRALARGDLFWADQDVARPTDEPAERQSQLSPREHQVLALIARGFTHSQIATRLDISPHTVDTYVRRIRSKWTLGNKAELTRAAMATLRA